MLEGLDRVDWSSLEHAYGPAGDVPDLLRLLLDDAERDDALHALYGNIFHQSTRYPATPHAVPFLVEIFNDTSLGDDLREPVLGLLTACVSGWLSANAGPYNADGPFVGEAPECDTSIEIRRAIDEAASKAIVTARGLVDDDSPTMRMRSLAFLACFRTRAPAAELVSALTRRIAIEGEASVRVVLAFSLGHLLPLGTDAPLMAIHDDGGEHPAVRTMAAIMLARRGVASEPIVDTLADALNAPEDVNEIFTNTCVHSEGIAGDAAVLLAPLGARAARVLPALETKLRTVSDFEAVDLLSTALTIAFGDEVAPTDASAFTPAQRDLLVALVQNDEGFWQVGNALNVLADRGLPSMREDLAKLVNAPFSHDPAKEELRQAELMLNTFHDAARALEHVNEALKPREGGLAPATEGRAQLIKGFCLLELDEVQGAMESFKAAIPLVDGDDRMLARKNTAVLLGKLGRRAEAITLEEENVAEQPESSVAWYDLGLGLVKAAQYDRCIDAIKRCLAIEPDVANAHYTIACAYALRSNDGDVERALQSIKSAVEIDEDIRDAIRDDDDFKSIRDDARFVALVGARA